MIFWITFPNISIFLWISIIPEPSELTRGQTQCEPHTFSTCPFPYISSFFSQPFVTSFVTSFVTIFFDTYFIVLFYYNI